LSCDLENLLHTKKYFFSIINLSEALESFSELWNMEKAKSSTNETQTIQSEDEKSAWSRFCQKRNINANLFMLKVTLFVMHGGETIIYHRYTFYSSFSPTRCEC